MQRTRTLARETAVVLLLCRRTVVYFIVMLLSYVLLHFHFTSQMGVKARRQFHNKSAIQSSGKYTLVGVVSYGSGCASSTPGVYARVQGFLPWIKNLISSGECSASSSGSSGGATTSKPTTTKPTSAKPTTTVSSNDNGNDYYSYYG